MCRKIWCDKKSFFFDFWGKLNKAIDDLQVYYIAILCRRWSRSQVLDLTDRWSLDKIPCARCFSPRFMIRPLFLMMSYAQDKDIAPLNTRGAFSILVEREVFLCSMHPIPRLSPGILPPSAHGKLSSIMSTYLPKVSKSSWVILKTKLEKKNKYHRIVSTDHVPHGDKAMLLASTKQDLIRTTTKKKN